jgi:hypothetical protein
MTPKDRFSHSSVTKFSHASVIVLRDFQDSDGKQLAIRERIGDPLVVDPSRASTFDPTEAWAA